MSIKHVVTLGFGFADGTKYIPVLGLGNLLTSIAQLMVGAVSGDTVLVPSGTYAESLNNNIPSGVTLKADFGATVIITPIGAQRGLYIAARNDITFDGFTIDSAGANLDAVKITSGAQRITIKNCTIQNTERQGILLTGDTTGDILIENCIIKDIGRGVDVSLIHAIYLSIGGYCRVVGCTLGPSEGFGLHVYGGNDFGTYLLERNYIHDCQEGIGMFYGVGVSYNNVVRDCVVGIGLRYDLVNGLAAFNTITDAAVGLLFNSLVKPTAVATASNNVVISTTEGMLLVTMVAGATVISDHNLINATTPSRWEQPHTETGTILTAFLPITDDGAAGIKPTTGNPAYLAGVAVLGVTSDFAGNLRGDPPTIGAWEPPRTSGTRDRRSADVRGSILAAAREPIKAEG